MAQVPLSSHDPSGLVVASKTLTAAQLLTLDTSSVQLLPAPGGRFYYAVWGLILHYRFNTTPYTGDFSAIYGYGSTVAVISDAGTVGRFGHYIPDGLGGAGPTLLQQTADTYVIDTSVDVWHTAGASHGWSAANTENQPLSVCNSLGPCAGGNGTLTVRVLYSLIDGAS